MVAGENALRGHGTDAARTVRAEQIVDVVEIVRRFLQKQAVRFVFVAVPRLEIHVAIRHVAPCPHLLHFAEFAGINNLFGKLHHPRHS